LDILRGIAVLLVLIFHLPGRLETWPVWLRPLSYGGWCGVDLFFALSGFLVGGLLLRGYPEADVGRFLLRRALKIYPGFYVMLGGLWLVCLAAGLHYPAGRWVSELLFVQNYWAGVNVPSWSLAVEEHFYLLLAATIWWLGRCRAPVRVIPLIAVAVGIVMLTARAAQAGPPFPFYPTHLRLDSLFWGVGLAAIVESFGLPAALSWTTRHRSILAVVGVVGCAAPFLAWGEQRAMYVVGLSAFSFGSLAWILLALRRPTASPSTRWLARLGRDSYGIYLWHGPIYLAVGALPVKGLGDFAWSTCVLLVVVSLAVGMAMSALIEWPVLRWRDRRLPGTIGAAEARHDLRFPA